MSTRNLFRLGALALGLGGVFLALFMIVHPFGERTGAEVAQRFAWIPAHTFHFVGALFTLFGVIAWYGVQVKESGRWGFVGFILAFIGTAMFVGTGMITAFLWPVIAEHDPTFVDPDGPMFQNALVSFALVGTRAALLVGHLVFGIITLRAGVLPKVPALLVIAGILLYSVPTQPVGPAPWIVSLLGAVIFGAGLLGIGYGVSRKAQDDSWP